MAALISRDDEAYIAYGFETYDQAAHPITEDAIFDVTSLTKIIATATAIMQLVEQKQLSLQDRVCDFFPQLRQAPKDQITIYHLLAHTAGFPGGEPYTLCIVPMPRPGCFSYRLYRSESVG